MKLRSFILAAALMFSTSFNVMAEEDSKPMIIIYTDEYMEMLNERETVVGIAPGEEQEEEQNIYSSIVMSEEEQDLIARIVAAESQDENFEGRMAVVEVIFNRVLSDEWPNTVKGVLSQRGQFSTWKNRNDSWVISEFGADAVNEVILNGPGVLPDTEYVYFSRKKQSYGRHYVRLGNHWFGK